MSKSVDHFASHNLIGRIKYLYLSQWPIAVADIPEDKKTRVVAETVKKRDIEVGSKVCNKVHFVFFLNIGFFDQITYHVYRVNRSIENRRNLYCINRFCINYYKIY